MRAVVASIALLLVALALGLAFGSVPLSPSELLASRDILDARAARVALGAIAGGGLACVGVAFQAVLRNPLAEPYILGVSGGSALGATIAILTPLASLPVVGVPIVPAAALVGGVGATLLVYAIVRAIGQSGSAAILLAGVVVNAIASALITFLKTIAGALQAQRLLFWLTGTLDEQSWPQIACVAVYVAAGFGVLLADAGRLNLLALGDEAATNLGVDVRALERRTFFASSAVVGAIVSLTGLIGFVGLMVPHALRRIAGPDVRVLLPASFFAGGAVLVLCDLASRVMFRVLHTEPPVGAVTALVGGPLFLFLLRKRALGANLA